MAPRVLEVPGNSECSATCTVILTVLQCHSLSATKQMQHNMHHNANSAAVPFVPYSAVVL
eukprot:scaffold253809_cov20-Tisochrysis_lutea.AAC.1